MSKTLVKKPVNKKLATAALTGILAVGAFSAAPAFAGSGSNGCSASGCGKKTEKHNCGANGCKGKSGCKGKDKAKNSCGANGCKGKAKAEKNSCSANGCKGKSGCEGKTDHSDNDNYND